jgi:glycosyltransferase involved in cell wall biosynthesis
MKVLYVTNKPIYPLLDGGCVAMDSFLSLLISSGALISHLCVSTHKHPFDIENYPLHIRNTISIHTTYINTKINPFHAFKSIVRNSSYNIDRFYSIQFAEKLKETIQSFQPTAIILDNSFMLIYSKFIRQFYTGKIIGRTVNVEYKIWEDYALFEKSKLKKSVLKYLSKQMKTTEIQLLNKADCILTITKNDAENLRLNGVEVPIEIIPHTLLTDNESHPIQPSSYFFIGAYNWKPNYDAALYLVNELFPNILKLNPKAKLHIAGSFTPAEFLDFNSNNVIIHGKIESPKTFMQKHGIMLAPLFSGSGVRIKILEALSYAVPVIATDIALQGINTHVALSANNTSEFIEIIKNLSYKNLEEMVEKGLSYIQNEHDPHKTGIKLSDCVK